MSAGPVFIVGMGRSGTSLMRRLLDGHPSLAVAPETHFLDVWMPRYPSRSAAAFASYWATFTASDHFRKLGVDPDDVEFGAGSSDGLPGPRHFFTALLRSYAAKADKPRFGEKTPAYYRHLDRIFEWFPDARVVYLVRDPRAVAASHLVLDEWWAKGDVYEFTRRWRRRMAVARAWQHDPRVRLVRYEDLVATPELTLRALCQHLGLEFSPTVLEVPSQIRRMANGSLLASSPVHTENVDVWRTRLSPADVAVIEHVARREMAAYGYDATTSRLGFRGGVLLNRQRVAQIPRLGRAGVIRARRRLEAKPARAPR